MAAVPVQGLTAWGLVHFVANVRPSDIVLLTPPRAASASSRSSSPGGPAPVSLAPCRPTRRPRSCAASAPSHSATATTSPSASRAATGGRGADVVLDSVGRTTHAASLAAVAAFGQVIFFGDASGPVPPIDVEALYARSTRVGAFNLRLDDAPARWAEAKTRPRRGGRVRALSIDVSRTLPLAAAAEAHHALESRASFGKIVLRYPGSGRATWACLIIQTIHGTRLDPPDRRLVQLEQARSVWSRPVDAEHQATDLALVAAGGGWAKALGHAGVA